ncbi:MAG: hypothetical protein UZ05_CHB002000987 [Chlorobi bacterium OLB5]|nr:MAG: hypothetical protein UZ05_CHB002000987 [Chlorobi bacterium OLB5]
MKNLKLGGFEIYLLQESLKHYKSFIEDKEFPNNSIITKGYVESMISQLEGKLNEQIKCNQLRTEYGTA